MRRLNGSLRGRGLGCWGGEKFEGVALLLLLFLVFSMFQKGSLIPFHNF